MTPVLPIVFFLASVVFLVGIHRARTEPGAWAAFLGVWASAVTSVAVTGVMQ